MTSPTLDHVLNQLDQLKTQFDLRSAQRVANLLKRLNRLTVNDPDSLIRLHELLLFIRAHPHNSAVLRQADAALRTMPIRISGLLEVETDLSSLEHPDVSGIAGTSVKDTFSYPIVRWLLERRESQVDFYWDWFEDENRLAEAWPRFMPLLAEDSFVEANIPYREWLRNARGRRDEVAWLLDRFSTLPVSEPEKAELYDAQKLYVRWRFNYGDSRTGLRHRRGKLFFHDAPMIVRRDVNLREHLLKPVARLTKLSAKDGKQAIDLARAASTVRYRELYGFTNGDPKSVYSAELGRGVELLINVLPPEKRLPLRAYHSAMIYKNGVPIGYFEGLSLFERMESGFNLYYTFRDGETAWLYARVLGVMRKLTGVSAFSLDPYQIGHENEEGIESGAFWFYRKLGFRSTRKSIQRLTRREEEKIASRKNYRTAAATLRRLAEAPMIFELDQIHEGDWDRFQIRTIGFAVQRLMENKFNGDATRMRSYAADFVRDALRLRYKMTGDLSVALLLIQDLDSWEDKDKELLRRIIEAKTRDSESTYLHLLQRHSRLRNEIIRLGSKLF
ncbi:MAG TPA: hypothetical protein VGP85_05150 [Pyrinomonadaceae bacterium]|nr:hypothetical protein [Pyrinomonadaceae bacterium]